MSGVAIKTFTSPSRYNSLEKMRNISIFFPRHVAEESKESLHGVKLFPHGLFPCVKKSYLISPWTKSERTKQMEEILNFQKPSEGLELVILLHTQY